MRCFLAENSGIQNLGEILTGWQSSEDAVLYLLQSRTSNSVLLCNKYNISLSPLVFLFQPEFPAHLTLLMRRLVDRNE